MEETRERGFERLRQQQQELGEAVRTLMQRHGYPSVAADGFRAPGVVVSYTDDADMQSSKAFLGLGLQTASGVPLQCDEGADFRTFRIGLFGLDKLGQTERAVKPLEQALQAIAQARVTVIAPAKAA
jgi:aspartate aminotransferase-like enzyme